jgi:hypothetical protein
MKSMRKSAKHWRRVGFEPTVRLPVQRYSSSKILVPERVGLYLSVWSGSPILGWQCRPVIPDAILSHVVRLQFRLQIPHPAMS